jgi:CDP-paratose 2-epimerase
MSRKPVPATGVPQLGSLPGPAIARRSRPMVITGGSGFIGSNLADALMSEGEDVVVIDNLCRAGVERNMEWLRQKHRDRFNMVVCDVRNSRAMGPVIAEAKGVFHLAGQTAVTTSMVNPPEDFEVNARGTLNVLEAVRNSGRKVPVIFASTNKVYGALGGMELAERDDCYKPLDPRHRKHGVGEEQHLDFCTPYGCSKGVADQYVLDYAKSFAIPTAVLRMSCIYGPRQLGTEDQGWVAHFLIRALEGRPITIFGDGKQVRDVLFVRDAVAAYRGLYDNIGKVQGGVFNLGGGPANAVSLRQVLQEIADVTGRAPVVEHDEWRTGDQLWFVADTRKLESRIGWKPRTDWREGLRNLALWLESEGLPAVSSSEQRRALA